MASSGTNETVVLTGRSTGEWPALLSPNEEPG